MTAAVAGGTLAAFQGGILMRVFYLTNRRWGSDPARPSDDFMASRHAMATGALFGFADAAPSATPDHPDNDWKVPRSKIKRLQDVVSANDAMPSLEAVAEDAKDVLFFIHGFANDFQNAIRRTARLAKRYFGAPPLPIAITWPSPGETASFPILQAAYLKDEAASANAGAQLGMALKAALRALGRPVDAAPAADAPRIWLVAHSMGHHALLNMLPALGATNRKVFKRVFLMAADEEPNELAQAGGFRKLIDLSEAIDAYYAPNDDALLKSVAVKPLRRRLGLFVSQERLQDIPTLKSVNCEKVSDTDAGGANHFLHQYYRARPEVIEDIRLMIKNGASGMRSPDPGDMTGRGFEIRPVSV
jgi:esterase/lipase superfamily enzyme